LITPASTNPDLYYDLSLAPAGFWSNVRSDGGDIRVTAQDGTTQLAREVSGFDYAGHTGSLFIGMGSATACYIYYGNPSATEPAANATYGKYNVWESAAKLVAHLEANSNDSTANAIIFTDTDVSYSAQKINNGASYGGTTSISKAGVPVSVKQNNLSVFTWVYLSSNSLHGTFISIGNSGGNGWQLGVGSTWIGNNGNQLIGAAWGVSWFQFGTHIGTGWHLVGMVRDGTTWTGYIDNVPCVNTFTNAPVTPASFTSIGGDYANPALYYFTGLIDEMRVYDRVLSPTEIATMYANQNNPASFWTTGSEE
jgi:hypothetical protein